MTTVDHRTRAHALLAPSSADRWIHCPASVALTAHMPETSSPYAEEGTRAHELAEKALRHWMQGDADLWSQDDIEDTEETRELYQGIYPYLQTVMETYTAAQEMHRDATLMLEQVVTLERWLPECWGTADAVIVAGKEAWILDLKYGAGVPVSAQGNAQLMTYAAGVYDLLNEIYEIETLHLVICQPRMGHTDEDILTAEELQQWISEVLVPAGLTALDGTGSYHAGSWCRWCRASGQCKHQAETYRALRTDGVLTDTEIGKVLEEAQEIRRWVAALEDQVMQRLQAGEEIPGWQVVPGKGTRTYTDREAVREALDRAGYTPEQYSKPQELLPITQLEKVLGKEAFEETVGGLIEKVEGKPTLRKMEDATEAFKEEI